MRKNNNNQYRPEQIKTYKQLLVTRPNSKIVMESSVNYITEHGAKTTIGDIVDYTRKEIFRINGQIHRSSVVQAKKDRDQEYYLKKNGWKVTNIDVDI